MFGCGEIQTVDLGREGDGGVDQEPVVGELQDLFRYRNNVHLTTGHGVFELLGVEGSETRAFMTGSENAKSFAEVHVADLVTAFQISFSQVYG